jgi:hypothetical protein
MGVPPMARRKNALFGIYHAMDEAGYFDGEGDKFPGNPANASHKDYKGPVEYPKMFYHPKGLERIVQPAEIIETPIGPKMLNEKKELIGAMAENAADEQRLRAAGWHDHPGKAVAARTGVMPATSPADRIRELESEIKRLEAMRNSETAAVAAEQNAVRGNAGPVSAADALEGEAA